MLVDMCFHAEMTYCYSVTVTEWDVTPGRLAERARNHRWALAKRHEGALTQMEGHKAKVAGDAAEAHLSRDDKQPKEHLECPAKQHAKRDLKRGSRKVGPDRADDKDADDDDANTASDAARADQKYDVSHDRLLLRRLWVELYRLELTHVGAPRRLQAATGQPRPFTVTAIAKERARGRVARSSRLMRRVA